MKFLSKIFLLPFILTFALPEAKSQIFFVDSDTTFTNQFFIHAGLEPALVTSIGYTRHMGKLAENTDYHLGLSVKFAPLIISPGAWRLNLINAANWRMSHNWETQITTNLYLARSENRMGEMYGLGSEIKVSPMHFGTSWGKGMEIGWQYTALTHIRHSEESKETYNDRYPSGTNGIHGPRDGWYSAAVSTFRLGFAGSRKFGDHWGIQLGIGALLSVQKQGIVMGFSHAQVPFYLETSVFYTY